MSAVVALLRGINVGGRARVPMGDLRTTAAGLGLEGVRTYLQSGNLLFAPPSGLLASVAGALEAALQERFDLSIRVLLRSHDDLAAVVEANPFAGEAADGTKVHAVFLEEAPTPEQVAHVDPARSPGDTFAVRGREIYVHYPDGMGRSKLTLAYLERQLGLRGTARNWNTVTKLLEISGQA